MKELFKTNPNKMIGWNLEHSIEIWVVEEPSGHGDKPISPLGAKRKKKIDSKSEYFLSFS